MRQIRTTVLTLFCLMLVSCGGSSNPNGKSQTINGNWSATLTGSKEVLTFNVTLNQTNPPNVDATNDTLPPPSECFFAPHVLTSTFVSSGIVDGNITGAFTLHITLGVLPFQNVIDLQGEVDGKTITGNFTFVGGPSEEGCDDSGPFKMTMISG
jgi:hypothetical protein